MSVKSKNSPESIVREIKRKTHRKLSADEKIRIVWGGKNGGGEGWKERWRGKMGEVFLVAGKIKSTDSHSKNQNPMKSVILKMGTNL